MVEILLQTENGVELLKLSGKRLFRIGRHPSCEIKVEDLMASRFHAAIYLSEDQLDIIITDGDLLTGKGSGYGVFINKVKLASQHGQKLNDGDEVVLTPTTSFKIFMRDSLDNSDDQATVL